jgi:hypothetical protein
MTLVESVNATDAAPCGELTSILMPDTEAIEPLTSSLPSIFSGAWEAAAGEVVADAADDVADEAADDAVDSVLVVELHATADSAVIPISARIR